MPAGSTQLFPGCYRVANSSCIDDFLPPSGNSVIKCADDITRLLYAAAPPGRGPVISSMEAVAQAIRAPALVPTPVLEPITWCLESPACITVVETAAEAVESVAIASTVEVVASFLVVAAEGIGLGIALFIILAILFPTDITIGSLFEYTQISPDTDFDTFDDWGGDHGDWYNSLKIYAEVIKTTKLLEQQDNIPIAWDIFKSQDLKATIDQACAAQRGHTYPPARGCDDDLVVYVPGGRNYRFEPMQETGKHIVDAMTTGLATNPLRAQWFYPARSVNGSAATAAGHSRFWYDREAQFIPNACTGRIAKTCDEFPFFVDEPGRRSVGHRGGPATGADDESLPQARDIGGFYQQCDVDDGDHFIVLPVKPGSTRAGRASASASTRAGPACACHPGPRARKEPDARRHARPAGRGRRLPGGGDGRGPGLAGAGRHAERAAAGPGPPPLRRGPRPRTAELVGVPTLGLQPAVAEPRLPPALADGGHRGRVARPAVAVDRHAVPLAAPDPDLQLQR